MIPMQIDATSDPAYPWLAFGGAAASFLLAVGFVISAVVLISRRPIIIPSPDHAQPSSKKLWRYVNARDLQKSHRIYLEHDEAAEMVDKQKGRIRARFFGAAVMLIASAFIVGVGFSQLNDTLESRVDKLSVALEKNSRTLTEVSPMELRKLADWKSASVTVALPDGVTRTVTVEANHSLDSLYTKESIPGVTSSQPDLGSFIANAVADESEPKFFLKATRGEQNRWVTQKNLKDRYGLASNGVDWGAFMMPTQEPTEFSTYGSSNLVIPKDGGYSKVQATLIWDGSYKLVGSPAIGQTEAELPIVNSKGSE